VTTNRPLKGKIAWAFSACQTVSKNPVDDGDGVEYLQKNGSLARLATNAPAIGYRNTPTATKGMR